MKYLICVFAVLNLLILVSCNSDRSKTDTMEASHIDDSLKQLYSDFSALDSRLVRYGLDISEALQGKEDYNLYTIGLMLNQYTAHFHTASGSSVILAMGYSPSTEYGWYACQGIINGVAHMRSARQAFNVLLSEVQNPYLANQASEIKKLMDQIIELIEPIIPEECRPEAENGE